MGFELSCSTQHSTCAYQHTAVPLILLIGLPGSGKSTLAATLLQECSHRRIISTDAIRKQLFGDENIQGPWNLVWQEVRNQFQQAVEAITAGEALEAIYDATNTVRQQRRASILLARTLGFTHITGLWLHTPLWLCLERNQQRDRQVPPEIVLQMHRALVGAPPSLEDGLDGLIEVGTWGAEEF